MPNKDLSKAILSYLENNKEADALRKGEDFISSSLQSLALEIVKHHDSAPSKLALALPTLYDVQMLSDYLMDFLPSEEVALYPKDEILRLGNMTSSKEMARERLRTLYRIRKKDSMIILYNAAASLSLISAPKIFDEVAFDLTEGQTLDRDELAKKLTKEGYTRVDWVNGAFEFALRGSIIDVFSPSYNRPVRIELDDDKITSIRLFSPMTTLSEESLKSATILPGSERPIDKEAAIKAKEKILEDFETTKGKAREFERNERQHDLETITDRVLNTGVLLDTEESLFPYYDVQKATIADYLEGYDLYVVEPKNFFSAQNNFKEDEEAYYAENKRSGLSLPQENIYQLPMASNKKINYRKIELNALEATDGISEIVSTNPNLNQSGILLEEAKKNDLKIYVCLEENNIPSYTSYLEEGSFPYGIYPDEEKLVTIIKGGLTKGFILKGKAEFLSSLELFGVALKKSRFLTRYKDFKPIKKYSDLHIGDYVVEEKNGIGIYKGIEKYKGMDYMTIQYAQEALLYVPIKDFIKIRKYAGSEAARPSLDVIGGATWARKKAKIKSRMTYLADRLLDIYAERERTPGISFKDDPKAEEQFSKAFPYPLTTSQVKAWSEIEKDMENPHPMDRLIAGDVGFGKTELAFKAMFKAVLNGYQAALLCPTTVLSRQHYEVAKERFQGFGVRIGILNRFNSSLEEKRTLKDLKSGKLDIVIGTHRLLSQDVHFNDLGLLVVDEEQKFGVAQKERIKEMTKRLDVLSLSATPIPRTLQMSLLTIRPMSTLDEAPQNRLPVKTYVSQENPGLVKEVIARELARGGQVYFLHNRIDSLYTVAGNIKKMFPNITVGVAHGQMDASQIADVMNDFYDGKIEVLVSTSIIESGLDVPNVNTILVENAQNFGLAQLYQIKGRVGRSNRLAYAYLFYNDYDNLTEEGRKRLKAIKEFTELGSGYKIAQQDLAIRGSGNILGSEQAGFVDTLGYETYTQLLKEVIEQKRASEKGIQLAVKRHTRFSLSFTLEAYIPSDFASPSDRINLYRQLEDCSSEKELMEMIQTVKDNYGELPVEILNLFRKRLIEIDLDEGDLFTNFEELMESFVVTLNDSFSEIPRVRDKFEKYMSPLEGKIKEIRFTNRHFILSLYRTPTYIEDLLYFVRALLTIADGKIRTPDIPLELK